jgi:hypothetical protein
LFRERVRLHPVAGHIWAEDVEFRTVAEIPINLSNEFKLLGGNVIVNRRMEVVYLFISGVRMLLEMWFLQWACPRLTKPRIAAEIFMMKTNTMAYFASPYPRRMRWNTKRLIVTKAFILVFKLLF